MNWWTGQACAKTCWGKRLGFAQWHLLYPKVALWGWMILPMVYTRISYPGGHALMCSMGLAFCSSPSPQPQCAGQDAAWGPGNEDAAKPTRVPGMRMPTWSRTPPQTKSQAILAGWSPDHRGWEAYMYHDRSSLIDILSQFTVSRDSYSPWHLIVAVIQAVIMMGCHSLHMYELGLSCSCCYFIWFMSTFSTACVVISKVLEESILWFGIEEKIIVNIECQGNNRGINLILVR